MPGRALQCHDGLLPLGPLSMDRGLIVDTQCIADRRLGPVLRLNEVAARAFSGEARRISVRGEQGFLGHGVTLTAPSSG